MWDWMLLDRDLWVMFRVGLGVLVCLEPKILEREGTDEVVQFIKQPCLMEVMSNSKQFIANIHQNVKRVPLKTLQEWRDTAYEEQRADFEEFQTRKEMIVLQRSTHCMFEECLCFIICL
jgi:hypothetical protein